MADSSNLVKYYSPCTIMNILRSMRGFYCVIDTYLNLCVVIKPLFFQEKQKLCIVNEALGGEINMHLE